MIHQYKLFLQWWLFLIVISLGGLALVKYGILTTIISVDITYISFIILAIFLMFTFKIGLETLKACKHGYTDYDTTAVCTWSDRLPSLGLIGTIVGLIYFFTNVELNSANSVLILRGMGTALYTTVAGQVCRMLLDLQVDNFLKCKGKSCEIKNM